MTEATLQERPVTSRQIVVGGVPIGGDAQIAVQSMTNTMTHDIEATVQQVYDLNTAGADFVRVSVNGSKALKGFKEVVWRSPVPLIADVHFDYRMALGAVEKRFWDLPKAEALVASALHKVEIAENMSFKNFKVSLKANRVPEMVEANKKFRTYSDAPLHLGVTEAGTKLPGAIKSAAALGQLLPYGIGDTIRISLAEDPVEEMPVAYQILSALNLRHRGPNVIACPSCARTLGFDVIHVARRVEEKLAHYKDHFTVAVMGCIVNGRGEARDADYGVAVGKEEIFDALFEEIAKDGRE